MTARAVLLIAALAGFAPAAVAAPDGPKSRANAPVAADAEPAALPKLPAGADVWKSVQTIGLFAAVSLAPAAVIWGGALTVRGRVTGTGIKGVTVALESDPFPFGEGWTEMGRTTSAADDLITPRPSPSLHAYVPSSVPPRIAYTIVVALSPPCTAATWRRPCT